ncbi:hypothetical protein E0K83_16880 [Gramella sp. BOM4]|nr:hypothetical protein [Christiangramia bathymodioli]
MRKFRKLFKRKFINYIAIAISALTLIAFIYQTSVISEQQHMSVYPHLMLNNEKGGSLNYAYSLTNKGVGPAIIEKVRISDGSGRFYDDLGLYLMDTIPEKYHSDLLISNITNGQLISPGEKLELISLNNDPEEIEMSKADTLVKVAPIILSNKIYSLLNSENFLMEIEYKSVYDTKWRITNTTKSPEEL